MRSNFVLAALFLAAAVQVFPQTAPAAIESVWQVNAGGGFSEFRTTAGSGLMEGLTAWADVYPNRGPRFLHGLGVEAEERYIGIGSSSAGNVINNENTGGGGLIYSLRHFRSFQPYGKFLMMFGTANFNSTVPGYTHDTRTIYVPGGGIDYEIVHHIWIRADYERQPWPKFFSPKTLYQQGVTIGAFYDFQHLHTRSHVNEK
jgi:opacity protein-like surface antigen